MKLSEHMRQPYSRRFKVRVLFRWVCCRWFGWHTPFSGYTRTWCWVCRKHLHGPDPNQLAPWL